MSPARIYLDNAATTPCDPKVVEAMLPFFHTLPGNAASRSHPFGWEAEEAVDQARVQLADLLQVEPEELVFTSGATESNNLAIKGVLEKYRRKGRHVVTVQTEHSAVLDSCARMQQLGAEVTYLGVDRDGMVNLEELEAAIREDTVLVSVMWANNETGVIQPMAAIGEICTRKGVLLMSDATQAVGKIPVHPRTTGVHLLAFSAHKMYGPKGVGALYVSRRQPRVKLQALLDGGGHEQGMRSGTLNVPGIVGFGKAAALALEKMPAEHARLESLRDYLEQTLLREVEEVQRNGHPDRRLPHLSNLSFRHVDGENLMMTFNQRIALSSGSACTSASLDPSHVLQAMGLTDDMAHAALRFSLGRFNTREEVEEVVKAIQEGVHQMREASPIWQMYKQGVDLSE